MGGADFPDIGESLVAECAEQTVELIKTELDPLMRDLRLSVWVSTGLVLAWFVWRSTK